MKHNGKTIKMVCEACQQGDYGALEEYLATGDEMSLFNGDLNEHVDSITALHWATISGNTECAELLLRAKADPHVRERMPYGKDPEDGETALEKAFKWRHDDLIAILKKA